MGGVMQKKYKFLIPITVHLTFYMLFTVFIIILLLLMHGSYFWRRLIWSWDHYVDALLSLFHIITLISVKKMKTQIQDNQPPSIEPNQTPENISSIQGFSTDIQPISVQENTDHDLRDICFYSNHEQEKPPPYEIAILM